MIIYYPRNQLMFTRDTISASYEQIALAVNPNTVLYMDSGSGLNAISNSYLYLTASRADSASWADNAGVTNLNSQFPQFVYQEDLLTTMPDASNTRYGIEDTLLIAGSNLGGFGGGTLTSIANSGGQVILGFPQKYSSITQFEISFAPNFNTRNTINARFGYFDNTNTDGIYAQFTTNTTAPDNLFISMSYNKTGSSLKTNFPIISGNQYDIYVQRPLDTQVATITISRVGTVSQSIYVLSSSAWPTGSNTATFNRYGISVSTDVNSTTTIYPYRYAQYIAYR